MILDFLARATPNEIILGKIGIFLLKFMITALVLYLIAETIKHIPYFAPYTGKTWGQLIVFILITSLALVLVYYLPNLRILHNIEIIRDQSEKLWLDVIVSGIALSRSIMLWHMLIRWLDRRTSG